MPPSSTPPAARGMESLPRAGSAQQGWGPADWGRAREGWNSELCQGFVVRLFARIVSFIDELEAVNGGTSVWTILKEPRSVDELGVEGM
ncbi:hypothetical protein B7463_g11053, partial [Scytalidium lignicola]